MMADAGASFHDTVDLAVPFVLAAPFVIVLHVTERCFIRQRTDGSRTERLTGAENNLCVFVRLTLVITGKVQVDIRLFVSLESQERLERDISQ